MASNKKTYYPPKTFDDDYDALVQLFKDKKWAFSGVDLQQMDKDAVDQRAERKSHDALEAQFRGVHETFGEAQEARFSRFGAALSAVRGAFRKDKAVMAELERFKRSAKRTRKPEPT